MFKRILVAVDKTSVSKTAYERAIALAKLMNSQLMVFHVLDDREPGSPARPPADALYYANELTTTLRDNYRQAWHVYEAEYTDYLKWLVAEARSEGVQVEFSQEFGDPGRAICDFAREWQADLIITGSQGRTGLSELFLGSVSNHVTHHAPCSVLVVHQSDRPQSPTSPVREDAVAVQS